MTRQHRVLYRRVLRDLSVDELERLQHESAIYPQLWEMIERELDGRGVSSAGALRAITGRSAAYAAGYAAAARAATPSE